MVLLEVRKQTKRKDIVGLGDKDILEARTNGKIL